MVNLCGRQNLASQKAKILKLKQSMWLLSFCRSVSYIIIYFIFPWIYFCAYYYWKRKSTQVGSHRISIQLNIEILMESGKYVGFLYNFFHLNLILYFFLKKSIIQLFKKIYINSGREIGVDKMSIQSFICSSFCKHCMLDVLLHIYNWFIKHSTFHHTNTTSIPQHISSSFFFSFNLTWHYQDI